MRIGFQGRRHFLRFLASSPLFATENEPGPPSISVTNDALDVMDFQPLAQQGLSPAHWGYLVTGVDDEVTVRANREAMAHHQLRARRLTGAGTPEVRTEVFGTSWDMPIYLSAVGSQKMFHRDGEIATARAAKARSGTQMLSSFTSTPIEEVAKILGCAPWFQLYMPAKAVETERLVKRAEDTGCAVMVWTIDVLGGRNAETGTRLARRDSGNCLSCHVSHPLTGSRAQAVRAKPMFAGFSGEVNPGWASWADFDRLRKMTGMKLVLKGIDTGEDASLACDRGADGIVVSNHGGRATETGRGTMDVLPEVIEAVGSRMPVSSTADSGAAAMSLKHSPLERARWALAGPTFGA